MTYFDQDVKTTPIFSGTEQLIVPSTDHADAMIESGEHVLDFLMVGYYAAANNLAQQVIGAGGQNNALCYPIMYLYRHYIELVLKAIVFHSNMLNDDRPEFQNHHNLRTLWLKCHPILSTLWTNQNGELDVQLEKAKELIEEFVELDDSSMSCRYPFNKSKIPFRTDQLEFSLSEVVTAMDALALFLSSSVNILQAENQLKKWGNASEIG